MIAKPLYAVNSSTGGFGNHLRWLLSLDQQFSASLYVPDYLTNGIYKIVTEEQKSNSAKHSFSSLEEKIQFINQFIYPQNRTWHNWLSFELKYRHQLDQIITFNHYVNQIPKPPVKTIVTTIDPDLAYKHYLKMNSNLNTTSVDLFKRVIDNDNYLANNKTASDNLLVIDLSILYNQVLDRSLYEKCINFFNLQDLYQYAKDIHCTWYNLQIKSQKEFVKDITSIYGE